VTTDGSGSALVFSTPRDEEQQARVRTNLARFSTACGALAGLLALIGLTGWVFGIVALERIAPGLATMKATTAICLLLLAIGSVTPPRIAAAAAGLAGVFALLVLLEYISGTGFGIDQLIFTDHGGSEYPGRPSVAGAFCLLLLAIMRVLLVMRQRRAAQAAGVTVMFIGLLTVIAYLYGVHSLYRVGPFDSIAIHTTIALILLAGSGLAAVRDGAVEWAALSDDAGAALVRHLVPVVVVGLPLIGYLCVLADRAGWVGGSSTIALLVVLCVGSIAIVTWVGARRLARIDQHRARALADLTDLKKNLEVQVQERAAQVQLRRDEIAVLEDRQRIAADLHDIVIQRLFAAGMFLQGAAAAGDQDSQRRIDTAVEAMDGAIKDLRASIFELGNRASLTVDLAAAIEDVCAESARVLGFRPDVVVDDPEWEAETVREDILAVLREALANVARHAGATGTDVVLRTGHGLISLTVTDDGRGISEPPHSSGTRNMADRARRRGGDCVWTTVKPHGTRVWWHVPGVPTVLDDIGEPAVMGDA
jgi:signal transduction histidine kinase